MSPAASDALARARKILAYSPEPERGWWNDRLSLSERMAAARSVGLDDSAAGLVWDALPARGRAKLAGVHARARAVYMRLRHQFAGVVK